MLVYMGIGNNERKREIRKVKFSFGFGEKISP